MTLLHDRDDAAPSRPPRLHVFVYGTLKRGYWNHALFARGFASAEEATAPGFLREFPNGVPILDLPRERVLATGGPDPLADAARSGAERRVNPDETGAPNPCVEGELLVFDDPERRLPLLDDLEGYDPAARTGRYRRALAAVRPKGRGVEVEAWLYFGEAVDGLARIGSRWPPRRKEGA